MNAFLKRTGAATAVAALILSAMGVIAPPAAADHGNNGTIKVDEQALDGGPGENGPGAHNSNDPHIACAGRIEWYGFDEGEQTADILFEVWNPTLPTGDADALPSQSHDDVGGITGDGPGGTELDGLFNFDLSDLLDDYQPHPKHGYHVKVTVHTTHSQGADVKHKVFWVEPCVAAEFGGLSIDKELAGNDSGSASGTEFEFTVACTLDGTPIDLTPEETTSTEAVVLLTGDDDADELDGFDNLPAGAVCTVTETDDGDADDTTWHLDGVETTPSVDGDGDDYVTVTIAGDDTVVVRATNLFTTTNGTTGALSVNKDVAGNDLPPAATLFTFRVDCADGAEVIDLDTNSEATFATFTLTAAQTPHSIGDLPTGAICTVAETGAQNADSTSWTVGGVDRGTGSSVSNVVIGNATTVAVVATNLFNSSIVIPTTGSLSIDKLLDGDDLPVPGTQFTFRVECAQGAVPVDLNGADAGTALTFTLTAAQAARALSGIPTGAVCSVEETDDRGAESTSWTVDGIEVVEDGDSVEDLVIGNGTTVAVVATNVFDIEVGGVVTPRPPVVAPPVVTPPAVAPTVVPQQAPAPQTAVLGAVQTRTLPRTGGDALPLAEAGLGLVLLGAGLTLSARRSAVA